MKIDFSDEERADLLVALSCAAYQAARDCRIIGSPTLKKSLAEEAARFEALQRKVRAAGIENARRSDHDGYYPESQR